METITYKKREGAPFKDEDTKIIANIIVAIEKKKGLITPNDLVNQARSESSPIHNLFEWDDTEAASQYRLSQARNIINHIEIEVRGESSEERKADIVIQPQRAFHSVVSEYGRGYVSTVNIVKDEDLVKQVVQRLTRQVEGAINEVKAFKDYIWLAELLENPVMTTITQIKEKIEN